MGCWVIRLGYKVVRISGQDVMDVRSEKYQIGEKAVRNIRFGCE